MEDYNNNFIIQKTYTLAEKPQYTGILHELNGKISTKIDGKTQKTQRV